MGTCSINFVVRPLVLIKFTPILLSLLLFDLIDLLHDKDGMFSYIIVALSIVVTQFWVIPQKSIFVFFQNKNKK
jgi:hypothetical protein